MYNLGMQVIKNLRTWFLYKTGADVLAITAMVLLSRAILTILGVMSRILAVQLGLVTMVTKYTDSIWLDVWANWDAGWYLGIIYDGYGVVSEGAEGLLQSNNAFFPLFPTLAGFIGNVLGNPVLGGLIVSNLALIIACVYLYKLVTFFYDDHHIGLISVALLLAFPTSFVLSSFLAESLLLMFSVMAFYYAFQDKWLLVGICGFFLALSKALGVFIFIPLLYIYFKDRGFNIFNLKWNIVYLLLIPLGLGLFSLYLHALTGDYLAFVTVQSAWGRELVNPLLPLIEGIQSTNIYAQFGAYFTIASIVILVMGSFSLPVSLIIWCATMIMIPLASSLSEENIYSLPRYIASLFPLILIMTKWAQKTIVVWLLLLVMSLLQGWLFMWWVIEYWFVV